MTTFKLQRQAALERKRKVLELLKAGWTQAQISRYLKVSPSTISRDVQQIVSLAHTWGAAVVEASNRRQP